MTPCNPHAVYIGGSFLYSKGGVKEMRLEEKLTSLRKEKGLTQLELAEAVHVSRQAVSRWEVGTAIPTTENLAALSQIYGVTVDDLLNDREELPAPKKEDAHDLSDLIGEEGVTVDGTFSLEGW